MRLGFGYTECQIKREAQALYTRDGVEDGQDGHSNDRMDTLMTEWHSNDDTLWHSNDRMTHRMTL